MTQARFDTGERPALVLTGTGARPRSVDLVGSRARTSARLTSLRNRPSKQPAAVSARSAATARRAAVVAARALANASCLPSASISAAAAASGSAVLLEVSSRRSASGVLEMRACTNAASVSLFMVRWLILACRDHDCRTHTPRRPPRPKHGSLLVSLQTLAPSRDASPWAPHGSGAPLLGGTTPPKRPHARARG